MRKAKYVCSSDVGKAKKCPRHFYYSKFRKAALEKSVYSRMTNGTKSHDCLNKTVVNNEKNQNVFVGFLKFLFGIK